MGKYTPQSNYYTKSSMLPVLGFLSLSVCCFVFYLSATYFFENQILHEQTEKLQQINHKTRDKLELSIQESRNKLQFLYATPPISGLSRAIAHKDVDPFDGTTTAQWKLRLETIFKAFIQSNPEIRQIRYIVNRQNGKELVRVEMQDSKVSVAPDDLLQEKSETDYFKAIAKLDSDEIFISNITLNREYGVLDTPFWPTFRVGKAIFDENKQFHALVIINIDASSLLDALQLDFIQSKFNLYLVDSDGYFVSSPKASLNYGLDLKRKKANWQNYTHDTPLPISGEPENIVFDGEDNIMVGARLLLSNDDGRALNIISSLPKVTLTTMGSKQRYYLILFMVIVFCVVIAIIYVYQRYVNTLLSLYDDQSRYEAIVAGSSDAIISIDNQGNILDWNESACYLFGISESQAKEIKIYDVIVAHETSVGISSHLLTEIITKSAPISIEIEMSTESGNTKLLSISLSPVIPKNTALKPSVSALIRDITETKNHQQQIISLNESLEKQVQERTKQLEVATAEATTANKAKSAFVANISHEIRTPLNGIGGMLELLIREPLSNKQHGYLTMAKNSVATLTVLINDLLDLTKIESGKLDLEPTPINLIETFSSVIATISLRAEEKGLNLLFDCSAVQHENVISDVYRIKQILVNLLGNAIKFTEKGKVTVTVATRVGSSEPSVLVDVAVIDTGIGITDEQQGKLFKPFTQANSSIAKDFGGTGLGLSISKQLTSLLGGEISVSSKINQGSIFKFTIKAELNKKAEQKAVGPILAGCRCITVMSDEQESDILTKQLHAWDAECDAYSAMDKIYAIDLDKLPDLLIIDYHQIDARFEQWYSQVSVESCCKLMLLTQASDVNISPVESAICGHLSKPIMPLSFLLSFKMLRHPEIKKMTLDRLSNSEKSTANVENIYAVLIVDDNEINRYVAQGLLEQHPIQFFNATNGAEAIKFLKETGNKNPVHLILMDCQMPVLNGYKATELIRSGAAGMAAENIPIIAMTAGAMAGDKDACLQAGMNDFISKPLDAVLYEQKVMGWLKKH